jgi:hypothetical protein
MAKITILQFSCIEYAELELGHLTVLIGPQASGKSVICKLIYFFYNIISTNFFVDDEDRDWKSFSAEIVSDFKKWFPPAAWGKRRFTIEFEAGPLKFSIARTVSGNRPSQNVRLSASDYVKTEFEKYINLITEQRKKLATSRATTGMLEPMWRIENVARRNFVKDLGKDYFPSQTFVPAGRSFFTSIGKAVAAFEQGGLLDPVTVTFGRLFTAMRERWGRRYIISAPTDQTERKRSSRRQLANQFFG